jgi:uncharacterized membrane protein
VILLISLALGIIPLAGIVWMTFSGSILNVDGLFLSLILLTLAGIFFLNSALELRDSGLLRFFRKEKTASASPKEPPASKAG